MTSFTQIDVRFPFIIGFVLFIIGTAFAYNTPASGYELSIYRSTPLVFWFGCVVALIVSVWSTFGMAKKQYQLMGIILGGISMITIVSLPLIRGYHYVGEGDSLSHLGYTRELNDGIVSMMDSRYPAVHTLSSVTSDITGIGIPRSLLFFITVFLVAFFIFVPLTVRELERDHWVTYIGVFSGFLILPINHVSGHMIIHPTSQAVVFAPILLYMFLLVYRRSNWRYSILFMIVGCMFVILHLQQAANYILFFGSIAAAQVGYYTLRGRTTSGFLRFIYPLVGVFAFTFWLWAQDLDRFYTAISSILLLPFRETEAAASTVSRGVSLSQLGGGIEEVFLKLFFVALIYCIFAGLLMLAACLNILGTDKGRAFQRLFLSPSPVQRELYLYFTVGFVIVTGLFFVYLIGGISDQYFRHYAFMMGIVTILGAVSLGKIINWLEQYRSKRLASRAVMAVFIIFLLLSLPVVFSSPYFYQSSGHVTEAQMKGYETAFEYEEESYSYDFIRSPTSRYGVAIHGNEYQDRRDYYRDGMRRGGLPDHFADQQLRSHFDEPVYLTITGADRIRDPVLYQGFRFSDDDFDYLDSEPGINKLYSNPEFDLYIVKPV